MHCKTKNEAVVFTEYLHNEGRTWCNGELYINNDCWDDYGRHMCYEFLTGQMGGINYFRRVGHIILEASDFIFTDVFDESCKDTIEIDRFLNDFVMVV